MLGLLYKVCKGGVGEEYIMSESDVPRGFFMVGGVPTKSQDLAPCIIFTLAYVCIIPLAFRRLVNKESRSSQLYGPAVFIPIRIVSFILRAVQTGGNRSVTMIIVTQIFYSAGFPIICDPVVTLLEYHITRTHTSPTQGLWTQRAIRALRLTLLASLIIGIIAGTKINGADTPEELAELRKLNIINSGLCLGIVLGVAFVAIIAQFHKNLPSRATAVLVFTSGCLVVAGAYRLSTIHNRESYRPFSVRTKVTFYVLLALVECLATIALFSVNVRELYAEDLAKEKQRAAKEAEQGSDQV